MIERANGKLSVRRHHALRSSGSYTYATRLTMGDKLVNYVLV